MQTTPRLFEDDACIGVNHRKLSNLQNILNTKLDALSKWCNDNQLTIHPTKSKALIMPPKINANTENFDIRINNVLQMNVSNI